LRITKKQIVPLTIAIFALSINAVSAEPATVRSTEVALATSPPATYFIPSIEISGFSGRDGERVSVNTILPLLRNDQHLVFLGLDGALLGRAVEGKPYNLGAYLGYRERVGNHVLGSWIGADTTRAVSGNNYQRLIGGVESYGPRFIFRANGFLPLRNGGNLPTVTSSSAPTETINQTTEFFGSPDLLNEGTTVTTRSTVTNATTRIFYKEYLPKGFNAEIGLRHHFENNNQLPKIREFRAFVGTYTLFGLRKDSDQITGLRARFEIDAYPFEQKPDIRVSLDGQYSYDKYQRGQIHVGLRLSLPLNGDFVSNTQQSSSTKDANGYQKS
jgi:hypothetical protein